VKLQSLIRSGSLQAVLFDFDGTLVDSVPDLSVSVDATLVQFGHPPVGESQVRDWVGRGAWHLIEQAFEGLASAQEIEAAYPWFLAHYQTQCAVNPTLYAGVAQGLATIQAQVPTALVTNKPMAFTEVMLQTLGLSFDVVYGGDSVANKKPAPDMLLQACRDMQVSPQQCVMIGDSSNDSEAAQALQMPVALFSNGYNHGQAVERANPDLIYDNFSELVA